MGSSCISRVPSWYLIEFLVDPSPTGSCRSHRNPASPGRTRWVFKRAIMIKGIDALCGIVEIDQATLVADHGRVGHGIEQLAEIGGLIHQRAVIPDPFELGVQLIKTQTLLS